MEPSPLKGMSPDHRPTNVLNLILRDTCCDKLRATLGGTVLLGTIKLLCRCVLSSGMILTSRGADRLLCMVS